MSPTVRDERGFVLSVVIFAVAALSIAATALFLVVQSENAMANVGAESSTTLHLANAGLARYMGETMGEPRAEVTYEMGGGTVTVTAERAMSHGDTTAVYLIRSEAIVADRRVRDLVSRRTVQQWATLRRRPFNPVAALTVATGSVQLHNQTVIDGSDACGTGVSTAGIGTLGNRPNGGTLSSHVRYDSQAAMLEAIDAEWSALTDTAFAFDYQDEWPGSGFGFATPADSFPTVRFSDDVTVAGWAPPSGRGLLVVDGKLTIDSRNAAWSWDGVIIAGSIEFRNNAQANINGAVLTGFEGTQGNITQQGLKEVDIRYNSCHVLAAAARVAMFSPIVNTWWETAL